MFARGHFFRSARNRLAARYVRRRLVARPVTIIADDCWGGRLYSNLAIPCRSPFIGCGIRVPEYLELLAHLRDPDALTVLGTSLHPEHGYPLLHTRYARFFGLHYKSEAEFRQRFERRVQAMVWDNLRIKIDLGKSSCGEAEVARWNALRLPASVALFPERGDSATADARATAARPHGGIAMPDWHENGLDQFDHSTRHFDVLAWLNEGNLHTSPGYRVAQFLLLDKKCLQRVRNLLAPTVAPATPAGVNRGLGLASAQRLV